MFMCFRALCVCLVAYCRCYFVFFQRVHGVHVPSSPSRRRRFGRCIVFCTDYQAEADADEAAQPGPTRRRLADVTGRPNLVFFIPGIGTPLRI